MAATRLALPDIPQRNYLQRAWCPTGRHWFASDGKKGARNRAGYCSACFARWWATTLPARLAQGGVRLAFQNVTGLPPTPLSGS